MATSNANLSPPSRSIEHPRPDFVRDTHGASLNGLWSFAYDKGKKGLQESWNLNPNFKDKINVPFVHQTSLSGLHERTDCSVVWYHRTLSPTSLSYKDTDEVLLHFGAVDYQASVFVDGTLVVKHIGGHMPFSANITVQLRQAVKENRDLSIVVRAFDAPHDLTQPRGKQYWRAESESIFYTPSTGIWQPVWVEVVPRTRISSFHLIPDIDNGTLKVESSLENLASSKVRFVCKVTLQGLLISSSSILPSLETSTATLTASVQIPYSFPPTQSRASHVTEGEVLPPEVHRDSWMNGLALWTPEHPSLYDITLSLVDEDGAKLDSVESYFGMRKVSVEDGKFCLNNKPYFQKLVLDQGYWLNGGMTAPNDEDFKIDILKMKELGMNGCRKHQKVEDPRFLYWADKLGFLVWGEMANAYEFSSTYVENFTSEWIEAIKRDWNHPCIVAWTPINESWGVPNLSTSSQQRNHLKALYHLTKSLDPSRLVIDNDGWEHVETDLTTFHDYSNAESLKSTCASLTSILAPKASRNIWISPSAHLFDLPIILTEFGGVRLEANSGGWGYETAQGAEDLLKRLKNLVDAIYDGKIVQGFCYTQLADVEQEVNGLLTADRGHKLNPDAVRKILDRF